MKIEQTLKQVRIAIKQHFFGIILLVMIINVPEYYMSITIPKMLTAIPMLYSSLLVLAVAGFFEMWLIFIFCELFESIRLGKRWSIGKTMIKTLLRLPKAIPMMLVIIIFTIVGSAFYIFLGVVWFVFSAFSYQIYYFLSYRDLEAIKKSFKFVMRTGTESITLVSLLGITVYLCSYSLGAFLGDDKWYIAILAVCLNGLVAAFSYLMMTQFYMLNIEEDTASDIEHQ